MSLRLLSVCVLLSVHGCSAARLLLDLAAFSPVGACVLASCCLAFPYASLFPS